MKHTFFLVLSVAIHQCAAMEHGTVLELVPANAHNGKPTRAQWTDQLTTAIRKRKNDQLIALLQPENHPVPQRGGFMQGGLHITPFNDALTTVREQKQEILAILNNESPKDAKCCKCCNMSYVWNRALAPGLIALAQIGYLTSSGWSMQREFSDSLAQQSNTTNYAQATLNAAPSIIGLVAVLLGLPLSMINAWNYATLYDVQNQLQNLILEEELITTYKKIEELVAKNQHGIEKNQQGIEELLARAREQRKQELDPNPSYTSAAVLENLLESVGQIGQEPPIADADRATAGNNNNNNKQGLEAIDL